MIKGSWTKCCSFAITNVLLWSWMRGLLSCNNRHVCERILRIYSQYTALSIALDKHYNSYKISIVIEGAQKGTKTMLLTQSTERLHHEEVWAIVIGIKAVTMSIKLRWGDSLFALRRSLLTVMFLRQIIAQQNKGANQHPTFPYQLTV